MMRWSGRSENRGGVHTWSNFFHLSLLTWNKLELVGPCGCPSLELLDIYFMDNLELRSGGISQIALIQTLQCSNSSRYLVFIQMVIKHKLPHLKTLLLTIYIYLSQWKNLDLSIFSFKLVYFSVNIVTLRKIPFVGPSCFFLTPFLVTCVIPMHAIWNHKTVPIRRKHLLMKTSHSRYSKKNWKYVASKEKCTLRSAKRSTR